ncbi:RNA polymerase sigma factor for flagellar operon FliA [Sphingomonas naasensis]|uniref:FliA/WhiG family RNA polymerase sigma factor n=1 Tax=Sphingomonas naasensis TaxID=1344951 RepID=A0A4S1W5V6_9SPHN|nr:RNA polymerase sigma factor FliA [Sphingomonas naasensis]NIJ21179.1 RNA polymerase sigma factor for flagellar operon FliA [Sphingomonas naasensis]TGX38241.1 FliA/WhiG family RNA polymerase sigma factor [Sphingomonas naasensis]
MASLASVPLTYARAPSPQRDAEAMVRKHLPLVRRIAWHVHGSMSSIVEVEDLIQIGMVALIEAVSGFEDRGQVTFEQYLMTRVRGAMIDELRRQATLTRGAMRRRKLYQETVAALATELGHAPNDGQVADKLGVSPEKLRAEYASAEAVRFDSIDECYSDESPWFMSEEPNAFDQLADGDQRTALIAAIGELPEREAQVIQLYYVEELNLEEIGLVLGVGAARVCQIKASAHARLKRALQRRLG